MREKCALCDDEPCLEAKLWANGCDVVIRKRRKNRRAKELRFCFIVFSFRLRERERDF